MAQLNTDHKPRARRATDDVVLSMLSDSPTETVGVVEQSAVDVVRSGSIFELAMAGLAASFAIVGLAGFMPLSMASFAVIAAGFALISNGVSMRTWRQRSFRAPSHDRTETVGMSTEVAGGFTAILLGVLAMIGVSPLVLLPTSAIVIGAGVLLGGPAQSHLMWIVRPTRNDETTQGFVWASGGAMAMAGGAALGLGIFGLARGPEIGPSLVAALSVGFALVLAGGAQLSRIASSFSRSRRYN